MSEINTHNLIERAKKLFIQQSELYGSFSVDRNVDLKNEPLEGVLDSSEKEVLEVREPNPNHYKSEIKEELSLEEKLAHCSTLEELKSLCEKAEELKTDLPNTNLVFGVGNPQADLMIVGEAPGSNEDRLGEPFVGEAGQLLDKIMEAIDFKRSDIYIANILKHRPPDNRDPKSEEKKNSIPYLIRQIELVNPKLILCVGRVSGTTLLGLDSTLKDMRQKFHPFHNRELMVTYHPAALLRNEKWKRPTWEDVQLLRKRYDELLS